MIDDPPTKPIWPRGREEIRITRTWYPVPLREDVIAELRLPIDLTKAEAEKLIKVLRALVAPKPKEKEE